jgi:hypothetical protein
MVIGVDFQTDTGVWIRCDGPLETMKQEPAPVEVRAQIERILNSQCLHGSDVLCRLLSYLAEASLNGEAQRLKEYVVGVDGLGKPATYDPRTDASVRVNAGKLRQKLQDYYRSEGVEDSILVEFPKGGFQLAFEDRKGSASKWVLKSELRRWKMLALSAVIGILPLMVFLTAIFIGWNPLSRREAIQAESQWTPELESLWAPLLKPSKPILLSHGSPLFFRVGDWIVRRPDLNDWATAAESSDVARLKSSLKAEFFAPVWGYSGVGDTSSMFLLARLLANRVRELRFKPGRTLSWEDIRDSHLVFAGSGKSQEQLRDILAERDFASEPGGLRNLKPRPGEPAEYPLIRDQRSGEILSEHVLVTYIPGLQAGRRIIICSAYSSSGILAAVEVVTQPKASAELVRHVGQPQGGIPDSFQAVFLAKFKSQVPVHIEYVTHHNLKEAVARRQ